jgi:hypothetical protein
MKTPTKNLLKDIAVFIWTVITIIIIAWALTGCISSRTFKYTTKDVKTGHVGSLYTMNYYLEGDTVVIIGANKTVIILGKEKY